VPDQTDVAAALSHVLWIGDAFARNHFARRVTAGDADAIAFLQMTMDQRWIQRSVEELTQEAIVSWTKSFSLVIEDLLTLPKENIIVAEGNFFPASVAPYLTHPSQAIWLTPTTAFCDQARRRKHAELVRRQKRHGAYDEGSDPEQRLRNLIERDTRLADYVKQQAESLSLPHYEVDGSLSSEDLTELVERRFDPFLLDWVQRVKAQAR
jgi:hypothetical protein